MSRPLHFPETVPRPWGCPPQRSPGSCATQHPSGHPKFCSGPKDTHPSNPHRPCRSHQAPEHASPGLSHPQSPGLGSGTWGHRLIHRETVWPGDTGSWSSLRWPGTGPGALGQEKGKCELVHLHAGPLESPAKGQQGCPTAEQPCPRPQSPGAPKKGSGKGWPGPVSAPTPPPAPQEGRDGLNFSPWAQTPRERP